MIPKYSIHTSAVTDRLTHILLKTLDSSALEPYGAQPQERKMIPHRAVIPGF